MSIDSKLAEELETSVGRKTVRESRYDLKGHGAIYMEGCSCLYMPPNTCATHPIDTAKVMLGALWLKTFGGVTYMIPIGDTHDQSG